MREELQQVLNLLHLPHRGSATPLEAEAFRRLRTFLEERGHRVQTLPFQGVRSYGWELLGISLLLALAPLSPWPPLLGAWAFFLYFNGFRPWSFLLDRHPSQNLLAWKGQGGKALLLMAHVDTAKTFFLYHPQRVRRFRESFLLNALLAFLSPLLALTPLRWPIGLYFLIQAALLLHRELRAPYVEGGNDNGSGVVVATALFLETKPPEGWRLGLALTGCEEVGALGAKALTPHLPPGTLVLNLDNVGRGELFYAEGEGMLLYVPYRGALLDAARKTPGARPLRYRLAYFDTLPLAQRGFPCLSLIRLEQGVPPEWHWPTDTFARLDQGALEDTLRYTRTLLQRVFHRVSS
ncbi:Zn-dependent exopeptidase M28 [Thermus sp. SYSU G05001]|uniref:Zn-dependent exopeptidase M28 n=1 Tax=Thermus brevis TaxID=2862456 RepID=A0ABS7A0C9_9DEIN|nr:M28 family peptidase [Thermus brevis]MBW6395766.1 Zn-dependent exopeptidase M28 [Thermus brevis]